MLTYISHDLHTRPGRRKHSDEPFADRRSRAGLRTGERQGGRLETKLRAGTGRREEKERREREETAGIYPHRRPRMPPGDSDDELFEDILNLEEQYYREGYEQGYQDGAEAGRVEGRSVGLKKGFEKFVEAGRLQGKAMVWANRVADFPARSPSQARDHRDGGSKAAEEGRAPAETPSACPPSPSAPGRLPPLRGNARLEKHVAMLYGMLEPGTLSMANDDESVNDFDSRVKGAQSRVKMIERAVGEAVPAASSADSAPANRNDNIEDIGRIPQRGHDAAGDKG
ncbi:hypothetical protein GGS23DRAFT_582835 [Durotheca rogersii]|uniref:uncharacterized protein n=1 Tax=Durotheca rogersii TaxID=419775 RepID=UPI00221F5DB0|nr:uncharacterized protein GGS23DRAFT_582835 [Durotheca rogersii]KAI5860166.1 hypothetical protein GGS23DRAFT_582835 [Durotheca rogersii]